MIDETLEFSKNSENLKSFAYSSTLNSKEGVKNIFLVLKYPMIISPEQIYFIIKRHLFNDLLLFLFVCIKKEDVNLF